MLPLTGQKLQKSKSKIRPPRKSGANSNVDPNESWKILQVAIHDIQNKNASKWSFSQLYGLAYNLVLEKYGEFLYTHVRDEIIDHLQKHVRVQMEEMILNKYDVSQYSANDKTDSKTLDKYDLEAILQLFIKLWDDHQFCLSLISQVLMYMDRNFTAERRLPLTEDIGLEVFQRFLMMHRVEQFDTTIGMKLIEVFLAYFNLNRNGEMINKSIIKSTIAIFESLVNSDGETYFSKYFEAQLILASHAYYLKQVDDLLEYQSGTIYINRVVDLIKDEESRYSLYLPDSTALKLKDLLYKVTIVSNITDILNLQSDGLKRWIDDDNYDILEKVYNLTEGIDSNKTILKTCLRSIVIENGEELKEKSQVIIPKGSDGKKAKKLSAKENNTQFAINYTKNFIECKKKYDKIIAEAFNNDIEMSREVESACTTFLNENNRIQEYLSLYIDDCIKKSLKNKTHEDAENTMIESILIFRYIKDKDIFERYYKNHLGKRLLNNKSISIELELMMINKLKTEAGATFTSKFEGMFKDIRISQDITESFRAESQHTTLNSDLARMNDGRKLDIDFTILTSNFWPMSANKAMKDVTYVPALDIAKASFEKYYTSRYNGRNLTWAPNMCTIDLKMNFPGKSYLINMPTLAAFIVLTCFNDEETEDGETALTFTEIQEQTKIPTPDLMRHLQSIAVAPKTRILKKVPMSRDIGADDKFSLNLEFKHPQTKFKILAVSVSSSAAVLASGSVGGNESQNPRTKLDSEDFDATTSTSRIESEEQRVSTLATIQKSREYEIDAAIVRVMKARKSAKYQVLVAEVVRLIADVGRRFNPQPSLVKRRVEDLVDKEYLRRDEEDREVFWYIA